MTILQRLLLCRISGEIWGILPVAFLVWNGLFVPLTRLVRFCRYPTVYCLVLCLRRVTFLAKEKSPKVRLEPMVLRTPILTCTVSPP